MTNHSQDIAVIGGSGFIGTHLVGELLARGNAVRILDVIESAAHPDLYAHCDLRDSSALKEALVGCDVIYNLAAVHRDDVEPRSLYDDVNVEGARNVIAAATELGIKTIVFTSSVAVHGASAEEIQEDSPLKPFNDYGRTKLAAEEFHRNWSQETAGVKLVIVRPTVVFGRGNRGNVYTLIRQIAGGWFLMIGRGDNRKSMAAVENVAAFLAFVLELGRGEHLFTYADKPDYTMNQLVARVRGALGRSACPGLRLPYFAGYAAGVVFDVLARIIGRPLPVSAVRVEKFCANTQISAERVLASGFTPAVTLEQALDDTISTEFGAAASSPRVVIVAPTHAADNVRVFGRQATTLAAQGYDVRLIAKAGSAHTENGVKILPVWAPFPGLLRFLNLPLFAWQAVGQKADVYHLHNPDTLPLVFLLKILGKRVIYDTHEDFAERILIRGWIPRPLRRPMAAMVVGLERLAARVVDATIVTQEQLRARYGERAVLIDNPPIHDSPVVEEAAKFAAGLPPPDDLCLIYIGGLSDARGLRVMIDVVVEINKRRPCRLRLIGPPTEPADVAQAQNLDGWRYVDYLGVLPQGQAFGHVLNAHIGLALIQDVADHARTSVNKLYEYMMLETPFVSADFAHWRKCLNGVEAGVFVDPANIQAAARAVLDIADDDTRRLAMGEAGAAFVRESYNWQVVSPRLIEVYKKIQS